MVSFPIKGIVHQRGKKISSGEPVSWTWVAPHTSCRRQELRNAQSETGQLKEVHDSHGKTYGNCHEKNNRFSCLNSPWCKRTLQQRVAMHAKSRRCFGLESRFQWFHWFQCNPPLCHHRLSGISPHKPKLTSKHCTRGHGWMLRGYTWFRWLHWWISSWLRNSVILVTNAEDKRKYLC